MKFRLTIARKIAFGFSILIILVIFIFSLFNSSVNQVQGDFQKNNEINQKMIDIYIPSIQKLNDLLGKVQESKSLVEIWVQDETFLYGQKKIEFFSMVKRDVPDLKRDLLALSKEWEDSTNSQNRILEKAFANIDQLIEYYNEIAELLPNQEAYSDQLAHFRAAEMVSPGFEIDEAAEKASNNIKILMVKLEYDHKDRHDERLMSSESTLASMQDLTFTLRYLALIFFILAFIIGAFTTRSIVKPVRKLRKMLLSLGRGVIPTSKMAITNDEIGDMSLAMNQLTSGLSRTTTFANELERSNFGIKYEPLSEDDSLGNALLSMRDQLAKNERYLEDMVAQRTEQLNQQKEQLEDLYRDVTASIRYAKRLQSSILPPMNKINKMFPDSFVFFKPKDIVSGDFYWFEEHQDMKYVAAVDCTGHGVPGAFMSLIGSNGLNQALKEHLRATPSGILDDLNLIMANTLNKNAEDSEGIRDGMDAGLIKVDEVKKTVSFAGANNPVYLIRDGQLTEFKGDKMHIGRLEKIELHYNQQEFSYKTGDCIYLFSDGFPDQFGGPKGKKYMYKQFKKKLIEISDLEMSVQHTILQKELKEWIAMQQASSIEQIDDILVIGIRL